MTTIYYAYQGGSRILNATRVDQSGADDADVTNWTKTNDFILAVNIHSNGKDTAAAQYKLRWRNKTDSGTFVDVAATGEINYSADTSLVNGDPIAVGGRKCSTQGDTWQDGEEVEGAVNSDSIDLADDYETEIHFGLDCSGATDNKEYEFELYDDTLEVTRGTCGATIKMKVPPVTRELVTTIATTTSTSSPELTLWLSGWSYAKKISLTGQTGAGTLYQVDLDIGASAGGDFHLENHCTNFPQDIEVTDNDGTTLLDFWIEDTTADPIKMWVKVADDLGSNQSIWVYYGKSGHTTNSDIAATFIDGNDFSTFSGWTGDTAKCTANQTFQGKTRCLKCNDDSSSLSFKVQKDVSFPTNYVIECNIAEDSDYYPGISGGNSAYDYQCGWTLAISDIRYYYNGGYSLTGYDPSIDTWYKAKMVIDGGTGSVVDVYVDDVLKLSSQTLDTAPTFLVLTFVGGSGQGNAYYNDLRVRKYNDPEPAFSSAGSEQSAPYATRELIATIATTTAASTSDLDILRELTSTLATTTSLSEITLLTGVIRELVATIAASTATSTSDLKILRELLATVATTSTTSASELKILREIASTLATQTGSSAAIKILREIDSAIATSTSLSASDALILREVASAIATTTSLSSIGLLTLRELTTAAATTTAMSAVELAVLREITSACATQTDSSASLAVLRAISTTISATTSLSQIELLVGILRELTTTIATTTSTTLPEMLMLREMVAVAATQTASSASLDILREIQATIAAGTSLSQIELFTATLHELTTVIAVSTATSTPSFTILRELISAVSISTASSAQLDILRELAATILAETSTSQIDLLIGVLRELSTAVATTTSTSASELIILREITGTMATQSASSASLSILRELQAIVAAGTSLSDIELLVTGIRELATTIATSTGTSSANLEILREFTTTLSATTSTADISLAVIRALSAQVTSGTDVGVATLLVLRELSATMDAETATSTIDLILTAAELIVDTEIQSLTPVRIFASLTTDRTLKSFTPMQISSILTPDRTLKSITTVRTVEET